MPGRIFFETVEVVREPENVDVSKLSQQENSVFIYRYIYSIHIFRYVWAIGVCMGVCMTYMAHAVGRNFGSILMKYSITEQSCLMSQISHMGRSWPPQNLENFGNMKI